MVAVLCNHLPASPTLVVSTARSLHDQRAVAGGEEAVRGAERLGVAFEAGGAVEVGGAAEATIERGEGGYGHGEVRAGRGGVRGGPLASCATDDGRSHGGFSVLVIHAGRTAGDPVALLQVHGDLGRARSQLWRRYMIFPTTPALVVRGPWAWGKSGRVISVSS